MNYPRGKLHEGDEGELTMTMGLRPDDTFIISFGKDLSWIGMSRREAQDFALRILRIVADEHVSFEVPND